MTEIWITLEPQHIEFADAIAARQIAQIKEAVLRYGVDQDGRDMETQERHKRNGLRAEAAARLFFGRQIPWTILCQPMAGSTRHKVDFSDFIDVKRRTRATYPLQISTRTMNPDHAYLLVCGELHPRYRIVGWCWGREVTTPDHWDKFGNSPAWYVKEDDPIMKHPAELRALALRKHEGVTNSVTPSTAISQAS
jgi:hypothetical protein